MESLCTSSPMNRRGPLAATGAAGWGRGERLAFCGSTGLGSRSMYVFMVSVFLLSVVWGVSPTTGGSAPLTRRHQIGRGSWRGRVEISGGAGSLKKKKGGTAYSGWRQEATTSPTSYMAERARNG